MVDQNRRLFLKTSAATIATLPIAIRQALAVQAKQVTGTIKDVKHVVILMQENRSFDHYFGTMRGVRGFGDRHPIPVTQDRNVWLQSDGEALAMPFHLDTKTTDALRVPGTPHSYADAQGAWGQGRMAEWPRYKTPYTMGHYRRDDIPFQFALAESFTICDHYHCSVTAGTDPNRIVFWSGASNDPDLRAKGINATDEHSEPDNWRCWVTGTLPTPGYKYVGNALKWPTIPDVLEKAGISWRIYQDPNNNWTGAMHGGLAFESFRSCKPGDSLYEKGMSAWSLTALKQHVMDGTLPAVSWVLPSPPFSEHPSRSTPIEGAEFTSKVLEALTANPDVWASTVFFQTFDENDGLYDHLAPPAPPSFDQDGAMQGKATFDLAGHYFSDTNPERKHVAKSDNWSGPVRPFGMGPRVPMYVVSPWSKGGWVNSQVFDHTSVGQFIEKRFGVVVPAITPWHRAVSGDLSSAFDFETPNDPVFPKLPDVAGSSAVVLAHIQRPRILPPGKHEQLFQEAGARPSRALPYDLNASARVEATSVTIEFRNTGKQGAVFHVYDRLHLDRIPKRYTVEAGKSLSDTWATAGDGGRYDLFVIAPNGFRRDFTGDANSNIELDVRYQPTTRKIQITARNGMRQRIALKLEHNAYGMPGEDLSLPASGRVSHAWSLSDSGDWYDFTLSAGAFSRRAAGRVETGRHGISDPAMGSGAA